MGIVFIQFYYLFRSTPIDNIVIYLYNELLEVWKPRLGTCRCQAFVIQIHTEVASQTHSDNSMNM